MNNLFDPSTDLGSTFASIFGSDNFAKGQNTESDKEPETPTNSWGLRCPQCHRSDALSIETTLSVNVRPMADGVEELGDGGGGYEWDDDSSASCQHCGWDGEVRGLDRDSQPYAKSDSATANGERQ